MMTSPYNVLLPTLVTSLCIKVASVGSVYTVVLDNIIICSSRHKTEMGEIGVVKFKVA